MAWLMSSAVPLKRRDEKGRRSSCHQSKSNMDPGRGEHKAAPRRGRWRTAVTAKIGRSRQDEHGNG
ncbi:hypothetical protein BM1_01577 [Bipolaris maydis]|nr:hypothetical protein BM1_01577 [Bipolaris maydis]